MINLVIMHYMIFVDISPYTPNIYALWWLGENFLYDIEMHLLLQGHPFSLKNAISTYQRLVHMSFEKQISQTVEVYIDDKLMKSL